MQLQGLQGWLGRLVLNESRALEVRTASPRAWVATGMGLDRSWLGMGSGRFKAGLKGTLHKSFTSNQAERQQDGPSKSRHGSCRNAKVFSLSGMHGCA